MRKRFFIIITLILCVLTAYTSAQNIYSDVVFYHTVERGQTVFAIAKMYDVKVEDIYRLNIGSEDGIRVGNQLRIPQKRGATATTSEGYIYHTIQARETLYGVSKKYNVNGKDIIDANPGLTHETFAIGKIIRIPSNVKPEPVNEVVENTQGAKEVYYTVPSRETIYNICQRFKTSEKELLKLNPELSGGLRKGMILRIPLRINESDIPKPEGLAPGEVNAMLNSHSSKPLNASKIALLLPFNADNAERSDLSNRMVEYYEGMLLAVDSFRNQGYATELFLYDIGENTDKVLQLLRDKNDVFKSVNLIIGGWSNE
ncbi:MAG: LysM peptidoglycan-binding domain-containing protein, partial [Tannerella sp.]|nr:LysM peptidoglycan-binding domain-containing protein [Tannerella sp.]